MICRKTRRGLGERADSLGQAAELARRGILVQHAASDATGQLRLDGLQGGGSNILVPGGEGGFHTGTLKSRVYVLLQLRSQGSRSL